VLDPGTKGTDPNLAFSPDGFHRTVELPPGLTIPHVRNAIEFVEANVEEPSTPLDVAQQRFPDLSLRGRLNPPRANAHI
jgi:hypothetical protein